MVMTFIFNSSAMAARLPKPKTAQNSISRYFKKYGKKYDETVFAGKNFDTVSINAIEEVSYHVVYVDTILTFRDGKIMRAIVKLQKRFPVGWKVKSWESVGVR